jgi:hypothetical protein
MTWLLIPAALAVAGFIALPFIVKAMRKGSIPDWITRQGVEVFAHGLSVDADALEDAIQAAVDWWTSRYPAHRARVLEYVSECSLHLTAAVLTTPQGQKAVGMTQGHVIYAWCNEDVLAIVRHEFGHIACQAMGDWTGSDAHHARFAREGFPFA